MTSYTIARVGHYTQTVSTSTQNASIWLLTAAAPSDSVFRVLCTNWLTYLLTYLLILLAQPDKLKRCSPVLAERE